MKEYTINGITSSSIDFRESDKIVKVITAEKGVISVVMKGIKKEKAKLKFAGMPFSFCRYTIFERSDYRTLKTAELEASMLNMNGDSNGLTHASIILEAGSNAIGESVSPEIFFYMLNALNEVHGGKDSGSICANFMLKMLINSGNYIEGNLDAPFMCDVKEQEAVSADITDRRLMYYVTLFENEYARIIKSAKLL